MNSTVSQQQLQRTSLPKQTCSYLRTPLRIYLLVMLPICVLQIFLLIHDFPMWMKISGALVVIFTLHGLARGYVRRLILTDAGAELRGLFFGWKLPWTQVRRVGVYVPGGGLGAAEYLFIATQDAVPDGPWQMDSQTLQIQNREGLLKLVESYWRGEG
jgi:hypothetical protein